MALAVTIGVVSLIAVLAVATLSLAGRMVQGSSLGIRDARLDGAVAFGLVAALDQWADRSTGSLAIGASLAFAVQVPGVSVGVTVTVTRVSQELFWLASEGIAEGAVRREHLVVRLRVPDVDALLEADPMDVDSLGFLPVDSLVAHAGLTQPNGVVLSGPLEGIIHVSGDATLTGGSGSGILIVDGQLGIAGPFTFAGVIFARNGVSIVSPGVAITGLVRAAGDPPIAGPLQVTPSPAAVQAVLLQSLTPRPVGGRRWGETH